MKIVSLLIGSVALLTPLQISAQDQIHWREVEVDETSAPYEIHKYYLPDHEMTVPTPISNVICKIGAIEYGKNNSESRILDCEYKGLHFCKSATCSDKTIVDGMTLGISAPTEKVSIFISSVCHH